LKKTTKHFYFNIIKNVIYYFKGRAKFSAPLLPSSVSHDPPEIIIICCNDAQETFLIINEFLLLHPFALSFVSLETQSYF